MTLFEFGSGNSTRFWSKHVASVISCEHDLEWYEKTRQTLPANVKLIHRELASGNYPTAIHEFDQQFDIIIIDGRERVACMKQSVQKLTPDGIIVLDNSKRERYEEGVDFLHSHGFRQIDFYGMAPISIYPSCTSIFYRPNNCLNI